MYDNKNNKKKTSARTIGPMFLLNCSRYHDAWINFEVESKLAYWIQLSFLVLTRSLALGLFGVEWNGNIKLIGQHSRAQLRV